MRALALIAALVLLGNLGTGSLRSFDEATYAQVARELEASGTWLTPTHDGEPWFHKPPLTLWAMRVAHAVSGDWEWSARILSALAALATGLLLYDLTRRSLGRDAAALSVLLLAATPHFVCLSRMGMTDVPLTAFITLALYGYWRARDDPRGWLVCGLGVGLAIMTKGAAAVIAPAVIGAHLAASRGWRPLGSPWPWAGVAVGLAVALPWHLAMWNAHGEAFVREYLGYHVLGRAGAALEGHAGGPLYHLGVIVRENPPWALLQLATLPLLLLAAWRRPDGGMALFAIWIATVLAVTAAVSTKLEWYVTPLYPALAAGAAGVFVQRAPRRYLAVAHAVVALSIGAQMLTKSRILDLDYSPDAARLGAIARQLVPADDPLRAHGVSTPALRFYAERRVIGLDTRALPGPREDVYVVTRTSLSGAVRQLLPGRTLAPIAHSGERVLLGPEAR